MVPIYIQTSKDVHQNFFTNCFIKDHFSSPGLSGRNTQINIQGPIHIIIYIWEQWLANVINRSSTDHHTIQEYLLKKFTKHIVTHHMGLKVIFLFLHWFSFILFWKTRSPLSWQEVGLISELINGAAAQAIS